MDFADCLGLAEGMVFPIETHDSRIVQPWQCSQRSCGAVQTLGWRTLFCFPTPCFARMSRPGAAHTTHPRGMHHRFHSPFRVAGRASVGGPAGQRPNLGTSQSAARCSPRFCGSLKGCPTPSSNCTAPEVTSICPPTEPLPAAHCVAPLRPSTLGLLSQLSPYHAI